MPMAIKKSLLIFSLLLGFLLSAPSMAKDNSEALLELFQRIDVLNKEIRALRGENEQLQYTIEQLKTTQKDGFLDVDERIDEINKQIEKLEQNKPKAIVAQKQPAASAPQQQAINTAKKPTTPQQQNKPDTVAKSTDQPPPPEKQQASKAKLLGKAEVVTPPTQKPRSPTIEEKKAYQQAYALLKTNSNAAIGAFNNFIKQYPDSPLAANSQYWIGEALYARKDYKGAVDEFVKVLQKYRKSEKAPDAAIKLGYSFYELKQWVYARRALENVARNFPNTKVAQMANQRLARMKADGHY